MQRFFVPQEAVKGDELVLFDEEQIHQLLRVLRMEKGEQLVCLDNTGKEYACTITEIGKKEMRLKIDKTSVCKNEPERKVVLYQALPKKMEVFEWVLQKGTEIGVSEFVPIVSAYCQRRELPKRDRLERILQEAAEQSERGIIPVLGFDTEFKKIIEKLPAAQTILLHSRGEWPQLKDLQKNIPVDQALHILIGPEGGFSEEEVGLALKHGIQVASLGTRILRTETAAIVAAALVL